MSYVSRLAAIVAAFLTGLSTACSAPPSDTDSSTPSYDSTAITCPAAGETDRYIDVPAFYDLKAVGAVVENIPGLASEPHKAFLDNGWGKRSIHLYYELAREFDPTKPLMIVIPGGPGGDHQVLHSMERRLDAIYDRYNVFAMDHRGVGCSRPLFPGEEPSQSMLMRYAAADIDAIRVALGGPEATLTVMGHSYGSMLAQTYALLFPSHVEKLVLSGAFSEANHFDIAQAKFESLATSTVPGTYESYRTLKVRQPAMAKRFLLWAVNPMYTYAGRVRYVPENLERVVRAVEVGNLARAEELTEPALWVMERMTRAIGCIEIFKATTLYADEFQMFPFNFSTCSEFGGQYEYFNYTESLRKLPMRTLIMGGFFDLITPIEAMQDMARRIPDNFFYTDMHMSHAIFDKTDCTAGLFDRFLAGAADDELRTWTMEPTCKLAPPIGD